MRRTIEAGPVLAAVGALLLLVSLFMDWYGVSGPGPGVSAWGAFEVVDLLLAALAVGSLMCAAGIIAPDLLTLGRGRLPGMAAAAFVVVIAQIVDGPPLVSRASVEAGAWLGFLGTVLMLLGSILTFSRVAVAVTVREHDPRPRVAAVDARDQAAGARGDVDPEAVEPTRVDVRPTPDEPTTSLFAATGGSGESAAAGGAGDPSGHRGAEPHGGTAGAAGTGPMRPDER